MKRLITIILTVALLLTCYVLPAYAADPFDPTPFESSTLMTIFPSEDGTYVFVDCSDKISVEELSFAHALDHPNYYSYIYTDVVILNYGTDDAYPVMRTWIDFEGTSLIYATSVTFTIGDKSYTFSDIEGPDRMGSDDGGYYETLLIKYGVQNSDFILDLMSYYYDHSENDTLADMSIPFVLHGTQDLEGEMSAYAVLDFAAITVAMSNSNGLQYLSMAYEPTPLKITELAN